MVVTSTSNLGQALLEQRQYGEAEPLLRTAAETQRRISGERVHPDPALPLGNLGRLLGETARYAEGEATLLEAIAIQSSKLGGDHPQLRRSYRYLAGLYDAWGKPGQAEAYRRQIGGE